MNDLFLSLHGLAIKKHAGSPEVAELVGLSAETGESSLQQAVASGRAAEAQGKFMLTPVGKIGLESQYAQAFSANHFSAMTVTSSKNVGLPPDGAASEAANSWRVSRVNSVFTTNLII